MHSLIKSCLQQADHHQTSRKGLKCRHYEHKWLYQWSFQRALRHKFYQTLDTDHTPKISLEISQTLLTMRNNKEIDK